jgi:hypothetical protein
LTDEIYTHGSAKESKSTDHCIPANDELPLGYGYGNGSAPQKFSLDNGLERDVGSARRSLDPSWSNRDRARLYPSFSILRNIYDVNWATKILIPPTLDTEFLMGTQLLGKEWV